MMDLEFIREVAQRARNLARLARGEPRVSAELTEMAVELQRWADETAGPRVHNGRRVYTVYL